VLRIRGGPLVAGDEGGHGRLGGRVDALDDLLGERGHRGGLLGVRLDPVLDRSEARLSVGDVVADFFDGLAEAAAEPGFNVASDAFGC
jgi:hypothetical protein